ncbi:hypothetical protein R5H30_05395 [Sulfitobacter sp. D35]|uniref:hypothetical protein n=1 Tax=Sulfitobacter sp. D35 TaxID=3083252 RepID=UPI00296EEBD2|nr:hypothetical protein [Sulfitobacter sp. D35]MDW4497408.1 hypothetical protein [Sulfitobacter sp. D35]
MRRAICGLVACLLGPPLWADSTVNPDPITVYFPQLESKGFLGRNVATVLSLQLAQTGRQAPWPENPDGDDFNLAIMAWSDEPMTRQSHEGAEAEARRRDLLAQIVIWGETRSYAGEVIADLNVTLPTFAAPGDCGGGKSCDFRDANFETWTLTRSGHRLSVGPPRRRFSLSAVRLEPDIVETFRRIDGLAIRQRIDGGPVLGRTGTTLRFLEFNPRLPEAPTRLTSGGVTGYVTLPELSEGASEFSAMVGGLLQLYRGDWERAIESFSAVLDSPASRAPLKLDALLLRGMARFRDGGDGGADFARARDLAPFDRRAVQYAVMGHIARGDDLGAARTLLEEKAFLFSADDPWLAAARTLLDR